MSVSSNVVRLFVAVASAHDINDPVGSFSNGSYVDSYSGYYFGPDIFQHPKTLATLVKNGVIEFCRDQEHGEVIRFDDRRDVLDEFQRGIFDAEAGNPDDAEDSTSPYAYLAGRKFFNQHQRYGGMAFREDQGRVCHGMVCTDTGERWVQG